MAGEVIDTVWIQRSLSSREIVHAIGGSRRLGYQYGWGACQEPGRCVPVGDVGFCEKWLGYSPVPDFYPDFLCGWFHRGIIQGIGGRFYAFHSPRFMKSATRYKAWEPRIITRGEMIPNERVWLSAVVKFVQEWRYYIADGCVLATGWYQGDDEDEPAPDLAIDWPKGFCGAVDFGRLDDGRIALVESHHPFSCGWYGEDSAAYVMWLIEGWKYMRSLPIPEKQHAAACA